MLYRLSGRCLAKTDDVLSHYDLCRALPSDTLHTGPVVDYGSTAERWDFGQRRRQGLEYQDPSPSYLIDVCPTVT